MTKKFFNDWSNKRSLKNIKINILDFCGNNHWHYEILIDDERFISGWYTQDIPYKYYRSDDWHFEYNGNGFSKHKLEVLKSKYSLVQFITDAYIVCFSQTIIDLVTQKIYELYKDILNNFQG